MTRLDALNSRTVLLQDVTMSQVVVVKLLVPMHILDIGPSRSLTPPFGKKKTLHKSKQENG